MGEERLRLAGRAAVEAVDAVDARGPESPLGARPEIEAPVTDDVVAEALAERRRHLLPHLVAAGPDPGADRGGEAPSAEGLDPRGDDALEQPAPAGMEHCDRRLSLVRARDRDRQAVG